MLLIFLITVISAVLVFFLIWEYLENGESLWAWVSFILFIVLIFVSLTILTVNGERINLKQYNINQRQIEAVENRKEDVNREVDNLINKLPEDTLNLYKDINDKEKNVSFYPNIEFVNLIEEQIKTQKELQKELTKLYKEQAFILGEMENRRTFLPGRLIYRDNAKSKLEKR